MYIKDGYIGPTFIDFSVYGPAAHFFVFLEKNSNLTIYLYPLPGPCGVNHYKISFNVKALKGSHSSHKY